MREELSLLRLDGLEIRKIIQFAQIRGSIKEVIQALLRLDLTGEMWETGVAELQTVADLLPSLGVAEKNYTFDCSIIRGLDYYTGTIFETQLTDAPKLGSICSGGRYENLVGNFSKTKMPGVGMSIGLTRLFFQMKELGWFNFEQKTMSRVAILPMTENLNYLLDAAAKMRQVGITTEVYLQIAGMKKKMKYADDLGVPYSIVIGDDEIVENKVMLKNMQTGEQNLLSVEQVINRLIN